MVMWHNHSWCIFAQLIKKDPHTGDKVVKLPKKEHDRKVSEGQLVALATKFITNKMSRQIENEQTAVAKRDKIGDDIDSLLAK